MVEILVTVRRHPNDYQTAIYKLEDIADLHISRTTGGINITTPYPGVFGYVMCNGMAEGQLAHSCQHGPPPHRIKVYLMKGANKLIWKQIQQRLSSDQERRPRGTGEVAH